MWASRAGIQKMLVSIANREDPDQTASSEAVLSGSSLFLKLFWQATSVRNFRTSPVTRYNSLPFVEAVSITLWTITAAHKHRKASVIHV